MKFKVKNIFKNYDKQQPTQKSTYIYKIQQYVKNNNPNKYGNLSVNLFSNFKFHFNNAIF